MKISASVYISGVFEDRHHEHPDHHSNRVQVVDHARHQVAGFVLHVEVGAERRQMLEQIVAQVVFDIAADVEDDEAREPAHRAEHQREQDHQARVVRDEVGAMLVGRVDRVADEQRDDHRERGVREGAKDAEYVTQPVASRVGKQSSHGLGVKLSGLRHDRSGSQLLDWWQWSILRRSATSTAAHTTSRTLKTRKTPRSLPRKVRVRRREIRRG